MAILTIYKLNGEVYESRFIDFSSRKPSVIGQKARVTIKNGRTYEGFVDAPYNEFSTQSNDVLTLQLYDINSKNCRLRSNDMVTIFIPLEIIEKIETILHSNPRWGVMLTNRFEFPKNKNQLDDEFEKFVRDFNRKK